MIRWVVAALQLAELFASSVVHLLYGFYIFSTAVAGDLSLALNECLFKSNMNVEAKEDVPGVASTNAKSLPPIVLVHGIFGFGKGVFFDFILYIFFSFPPRSTLLGFEFVCFVRLEIGRFIVFRRGREERRKGSGS